MTIFPTITTGTPVLSVNTGVNPNITYETIIQMLTEWSMIAEMIGYNPKNFNQLASQFFYNTYETNANTLAEMLITIASPMQYNPSSFLGLQGRPMVFQGSSALAFNIQPREQIQLNFFGRQIYKRHAAGGPTHAVLFDRVAAMVSKSGFFKDYTDQIE